MVTSWRIRNRLETSYWPRDQCTICEITDCDNECPIYTEEYGELEQEFIEYQERLENQVSGSLELKPSPLVGKNRDREAER